MINIQECNRNDTGTCLSMSNLVTDNLIFLSYRNDFISTKFGEEMVQKRFEVVSKIERNTFSGRYLTKTIVESEESLIGLGF